MRKYLFSYPRIMSEQKTYELMALFAPDKKEKEHVELGESIKATIKELGGVVTEEDVWGLRDLAYRIKKYNQGYYVVYQFNIPSDKVQELEEFLRLEQVILRHVIVLPPRQYVSLSYAQIASEEHRVKTAAIKAVVEDKKPVRRVKPAAPVREKEEKASEAKEKDISDELDAKLSKIIDEDIEI